MSLRNYADDIVYGRRPCQRIFVTVNGEAREPEPWHNGTAVPDCRDGTVWRGVRV